MFGKQDWPGVWGHLKWSPKPQIYFGVKVRPFSWYWHWNAKWATIECGIYIVRIVDLQLFIGLPWFARDYWYYADGGEWKWTDIVFFRWMNKGGREC